MKLIPYLDSLSVSERKDFAKRCGTTDGYLAQLKGGHRYASAKLARRMVKQSQNQLTLDDLLAPDQSAKVA